MIAARDAFYVGEISSRRYVLSRSGRLRRIDCVDVVIFVTGFVLDEEDVLAVARPEVTGDRPLGVGGDRLCIGEGLGRLLHPDVAHAFVGFDKGDEGAVRGDLRAGDFRVTKEKLAVNQRRTLRPNRRRKCEIIRVESIRKPIMERRDRPIERINTSFMD